MTETRSAADLGDLHKALGMELLRRVKSGGATAADLAVAAKFLRDNSITTLPQASPELLELADALPFRPEAEAA